MSNLLSQASLVMIPSGYKEDVVYSQIPTSGAGDLSFTRASNGTRVNSAGLVEVCPWNLVEYSEDFSNGNFWGSSNQSLTTNATTAPNGTSTADLLIPSAGTGDHYLLSGTVSNISGQVVTISLFVKKKDNDYFYFGTGGASAFGAVVYQFSTNTFVVAGLSATATNIGNGWIRLSITGTTGATDLRLLFTPTDSTGSRTYNANGTDGTYIWGAQANIGATLKPYFPTTDRLNVPRLTYQNGGGGCPSLLLEKQSTNYFTYSEELQTGTGGTITVTPNTTISPDGTQNADSLGTGYLTKSLSATAGTWTFSTFAKYLSANTFNIYIYDGGYYAATFNVNTGVVSSVSSGVTASIENMGNGWYRCIMTATTANNVSEVGFGSGNIYAWGCQFE